MSILNVNKINPVGGGSTVTIAGIASVTNNISVGNSVTASEFYGDGSNLTGLVSLANGADNRVITASSASALTGESELTYSTYLNLTRSNGDTNFGDNSAPGGVNGIFIGNSQSTNGVFSAITLAAKDTNGTDQSASFIAKSVSGGYAPEVHISSRTASNTNESNFKITSSREVEVRYQGSTKLKTTNTGVIVTGTVTDSKGELRNFPQVSVTSQHTIVASDVGKHIKNTSGGWIVNGSTGFAVGDVCRVVNASGSSQVVTQSGVTLYSCRDSGTSGNHSIKARGAATIICTGSDEYYVSGDI